MNLKQNGDFTSFYQSILPPDAEVIEGNLVADCPYCKSPSDVLIKCIGGSWRCIKCGLSGGVYEFVYPFGWKPEEVYSMLKSENLIAHDWSTPEPLLRNDKLEVEKFNPEWIPENFRAWVVDIAYRMNAPIEFCVVPLFCMLASLIGNKITLRPKQNDNWTIMPNLWGMVIGHPSTKKTPAANEILKPLSKLEREAKELYELEMENAETGKMIYQAQKDNMRDEINKRVKQNHVIEKELYDIESPQMPKRKRYLVQDATIEKLAVLLNENPNGFLVERDELAGWLLSLDKKGAETARPFFLECWNGYGRYSSNTIGRGTVDVEHPILSIFGTTQPGIIGRYVNEAVSGRKADGLLQRFQAIAYPDIKPLTKIIDKKPDIEAQRQAYKVIERLATLKPEETGAIMEEDCFPYIRFSLEAQEVFNSWHLSIEQRAQRERSEAFAAWLGKAAKLCGTIAIISNLADERRGIIQKDTIEKAIAITSYFESHTRRLYDIKPDEDDLLARDAQKLVDYLETRFLLQGKDEIAFRDIQQNFSSTRKNSAYWKEVVNMLIALDYIRPIENRQWYEINPHIKNVSYMPNIPTGKG